MLKCYMFAICESSSLDRDGQTFSLFTLIEAAHVGEWTPGSAMRAEAHVYLLVPDEELHNTASVRIVWTMGDQEAPATDAFAISLENRRYRMRVKGLFLPPSPGEWVAVVEVARGDSWERITNEWPVDFRSRESASE